jgi:hypothetical protein
VPPELELPDVVDRQHLPQVQEPAHLDWKREASPDRIADLVRAVVRKVSVAADESAIHAFVAARLATLRRESEERYGAAMSDIDALGFEGVMGTILGLMVFLAQAGALFDLPPMGAQIDSSAIVQSIAANVSSVQLGTVMTAFITSLIGWGARAWLGGVVEGRRRRELASVTAAEGWLQDGLLARLHLPAEIHSVLRLAELDALTAPLVEALRSIDLSELAFDVEYVAGGIRLRSRSGLRLAVNQ